MSVIGDLLFYNSRHVGIDDAVRTQVSKIQGMVDGIPEGEFDRLSDDEAVAKIAEDCRFDPLVVDFENTVPKIEETTLEVRDSFGWDRGTANVPALKITKSIPFTGDKNIWQLIPGQWSSSPPRGEVRDKALTVGIVVRAESGEEAKAYIDRTVEDIKGYLPLQKKLIDDYNGSLPERVRPYVVARRSRRKAASDLLSRL